MKSKFDGVHGSQQSVTVWFVDGHGRWGCCGMLPNECGAMEFAAALRGLADSVERLARDRGTE